MGPRGLLALMLCAGVTTAAGGGLQSIPRRADVAPRRFAGPQAGPASPLAATDDGVYAVTPDEHSVLSRPVDLSAPWRIVATIPGRVGGLAMTPRGLFVTDRAAAAIVNVDVETGELRPVHTGAPLKDPSDLAYGAGALYIADSADGRVFRAQLREGRLDLTEIELPSRPAPGGRIFLAAAQNSVFVSIPGNSEIYDITRAYSSEMNAKASIVKRKEQAQSPAGGYLVDTIQKRAFPGIAQPGRIALFRGVIYAGDEQTKQLYAFSRHNPRPVRLVRSDSSGASTLRASAVAVTAAWMFSLDSDGELIRMPRLVPAEINLRLTSVSEAMAAFYQYQYDRGILPVRSVEVSKNLERTLRDNHVLIGAYVTQLDSLLCRLNRSRCDGDKLGVLQPTQSIRVPDVNSENYIDAVSVTLKGETLRKVADRSVQSAEFAAFRSDERLREMNDTKDLSAADLTSRTTGTFVVPMEYVRYVAAINAFEAPPRDGPLTSMTKQFEGLSIISQEERLASAYGRETPQPPQPPTESQELQRLREAFQHLLNTIAYEPLPEALNLRVVKVGIAEKAFDPNHPVFGETATTVWLPPEDELEATNAGVGTVPAFSTRASTELDHGTSVAALIAGRKLAFGGSGLAPKVLVVPIHSSDPAIGEDIRKAYLRGVRLFNVSAHYGLNVEPPSLRDRIVTHKDALFVVAAGNNVMPDRPVDQQQVCRDFRAYPVCWSAEFPNLLVVTGTNIAGDALVPPIASDHPVPGTNWSPTSVQIAAPGDGFYAPGAGGAYVPVSGSSFAAPLVTATAALLQAQRIVDPVQIKQRIIATADPIVSLSGRVLAGRLNVRRAILDPTRGVLSRAGAQNTTERLTLLPDHAPRITMRASSGPDRVFHLDQIKRLHKFGTGYRIVFITDDGDLKVISDLSFPTAASSQFRCQKEDGSIVTIDFQEWDDYVGPISQ